MARATHLTISTADRIRLDGRCGEEDENGGNEVRQEVQVSVTYTLDPGDTDLVRLADRKALEVTLAHEAAWNRIGAFRGGGRDHSGGASAGRCPGPHMAGGDREADESDGPDDRSDDDPLAGLPHRGGDPFGGPPSLTGATHPYPTAPPDRETQNGNGVPPQGGRYMPDASSQRNGNGCPDPAPEPDAEPLTGPQKILIRSRANKIGLTPYALESLLYQQFKVWRVERLTKDQAASLLDALERDLKGKKAAEKNDREKNGKEGAPHAGDTGGYGSNGRAATA